MSKINAYRWTYGAAAMIFLFVAMINGWMIVSGGLTSFRAIAAVAFAIGGILLSVALKRITKLGS